MSLGENVRLTGTVVLERQMAAKGVFSRYLQAGSLTFV